MTRTLCTQYIDPTTIQHLVANSPIPLDKGNGAVRPIGVREVFRRICGNSVMSVPKKDVQGPVAHSSCVLDKYPEARLQYALCILHLNKMTLKSYCSSTPLNAFNELNSAGTTSVFCAL